MSIDHKSIVVSCVTFETAKITDPIAFCKATKVHLIWYASQSNQGKMYKEFYDRVCEIIKKQSPHAVEIVSHHEKVYDFTAMLRTVLAILQKEKEEDKDCRVNVNISSGTSEYTAAAAIASMMVPGTIPFSVSTEVWTIKDDDTLRRFYYDSEGNPVGLTEKVGKTFPMPYYSIDVPDKNLVKGLRILNEKNEKNLPTTSSKMIKALKEKDLWKKRPTEEGKIPLTVKGEIVVGKYERKAEEKKQEAVYYHRDFVNKWKNNGWVERVDGAYIVTELGENILKTFYVD